MIKFFIFLVLADSCFSFDCEKYRQFGCNGCVSNYESLSNYCVWCGSTDNSSISRGLCLDSRNPRASVTTCTSNSNNPCCLEITYGSNIESTCAGNFDAWIKNKMLSYVGFMFSMTIVVSAICYSAYKYYFHRRNPVTSFLI